MKKTYFIADLHLSDDRPQLTALFVDFMQRIAPQAEAVYILGDLFDFWIGDDERSSTIDTVRCQIKRLTDRQIPCYFIHGNRDFLLGKRFAQSCGLRLLPEYYVADLYGTPTLLCHGDTLCTDDVKYQQFRRKVHRKWRQWLFLHLPLRIRLKIADNIRRKSLQDKQNKSTDIMDVNAEFVRQIMARYGVSRLIHGHTHREKLHFLTPHFEHFAPAERIVLGDWRDNYASILQVSERGCEFLFRQPA